MHTAQKHTPTPWRHQTGVIDDNTICAVYPAPSWQPTVINAPRHVASDEAKANAEFIVRACNAHEDLIAALRGMIELHRQRERVGGAPYRDSRVDAACFALAQAGAT